MLGNMCRHSKYFHPAIDWHGMHLNASVLVCLLLLFCVAGIRSRVANLLGNMCRHSGYFYPALERHGILPPLIERCSDPDKGARWVESKRLCTVTAQLNLRFLHVW
jgi:fused-like protein